MSDDVRRGQMKSVKVNWRFEEAQFGRRLDGWMTDTLNEWLVLMLSKRLGRDWVTV